MPPSEQLRASWLSTTNPVQSRDSRQVSARRDERVLLLGCRRGAISGCHCYAVRVSDLKVILENARVEPMIYSFDGERHEALCLLSEGPVWKVFLSERGSRYEERSFRSEDEACTYFLKRIFELSRVD